MLYYLKDYLKDKKLFFLSFVSLVSILALFSFSKIRALTDCDWSGWVNGWQDEFTYEPLDVNEVIAGVHSKHNNHYEDRKFDFYCCDIQSTIPKPPSPPLNLSYACSSSGNKVTLSWDHVFGATSYGIRVHDGTREITSKEITNTSYTQNINCNHNYTWWVHAINSAGWSDASHSSFNCSCKDQKLPSCNFTISPSTIKKGEKFFYSWSSQNCQRLHYKCTGVLGDYFEMIGIGREGDQICDFDGTWSEEMNFVGEGDCTLTVYGQNGDSAKCFASLKVVSQENKPSLSCISNACSNNVVSFKWKANLYGKNIDDFELDIKEGNSPWQILLSGVANQNCYSDCYCPVNSSCYNDFKNNYNLSQGQLTYIYWTEGDEIVFWFKYGGKENTSYKFRGKIKTEYGWSDWAECKKCKCEVSKCINCSDCGSGLFNTCDRQECLSCQENCYFIDKAIGGDCFSCSSANSCQDYQNDETTCQTDPCGFGNCKWENNRCVTKSIYQDQRKIKERDIIERTNHGILEEVKNYHGDTQMVLHLWGTHYERGYAHGYLLAKEIPEMFKYTLEIDDIGNISLYNQIKTQLLPKYYFKDEYNQELQGIYDGMIQKLKEINRLDLLCIPSLGKDMDLEDLKMHQLMLEVLRYKGITKSCSGLAIWGDYSKNEHTVLAKSTDFKRGSKEQVCKHHLIVTVDPAENDEVKYFALSLPGFLGTFSAGVNRYGIFVSTITGDETLSDITIVQHLTPNNLIYKEILEEIKSSSKSSFNNIKDIYEAKTLWPVQDLIALPSQGDSNNAIVMEDGFQIGPFIRWPESELHQKAYDAGITNDKFRIISISSNYYLPETVPCGKGFVDPKMYDYIIEKFENAKNKGRIDVDSMYDIYREAHNKSNPYYNNDQGVSAIAADLNNMEFLITQCCPGEIGGWYYQIEPIRYKWDDLFYYKQYPTKKCLGDINNDRKVDIYDLAILMAHWDQEDAAANNDNTVNLENLKIILTHWGEICENQCQIQGDVDNNGEINCSDLDCVLEVILGEKSLEEYPCSDVNKDEEINQLDVSKEIDILLSKGIECGKCKQCSDCGSGLFNTCDRQECLSCQENCYFIDKAIGGDCFSCSSANSCQDYQNDETTCQTDPCGFGNCKWENNKCISK